MLVEDLLAFECGEAAQLHGEDCVGLHIVHAQQIHEPGAGNLHGLRGADEVDHLVDHVEGLEIALQNVIAFLGLSLEVCGAAGDHVELVGDPVANECVEAQRARHAVDEREHVRTEGLLELGVLVQVVEHHLRHGVALEYEHEALAGAARGLVAHVGDAGDLAVAHGLANRGDEAVRVHLVRQLGDDQAHTALDLLGVDHRTHRDEATAGAVSLFDALVAENRRACREVRALDAFDQGVEQLLAAGLGVVERPMHAICHLAHVVRRDIRGHAHGDARGAVDEQIREAGGQHGGLLRLAVVVRHEVHGIFIDVAHHFHGERRHTAFGVTHGGRRVVARGAEVALAVDEQVAHRPRLGHTHQGVVDGGVAVRVVLAHHVAHDARALVVAAVRAVAAVVHRIDHTAVHRLHAIADVGQCSLHNDGEGVGEVRLPHLVLQIDRLHALAHHEAVVGVVGLLRAERLQGAVRQMLFVAGVVDRAVVEAVVGWFVCHLKSFTLLLLRLHTPRPVAVGGPYQASIQRALCALRWMNRRRGSTSSPMSMENVSSACRASSICTCFRMRWSGSMVVSHSSW